MADPEHFIIFMPEDLTGRVKLSGDADMEKRSFSGHIETTVPVVILTKERYEALRDAAAASGVKS